MVGRVLSYLSLPHKCDSISIVMTRRCPQLGCIANVERQKIMFINHETFICYCELALFVPHMATDGTLLVYYTDYLKDILPLFFNTAQQMIFFSRTLSSTGEWSALSMTSSASHKIGWLHSNLIRC